MRKALLVGSVAFDYIMRVFPTIRKEIPLKNGKIEALNMAFVSDSLVVHRGGTAGNIAFGVAFLGGNAILHSVVGRDFMQDYGRALSAYGVELAVKTYEDYESARAYMISDVNNEQIIIWQPNAIKFLEETDMRAHIAYPRGVVIACFSPGNAESTLNGMRSTKELDSKIFQLFSPGQMVQTYSREQYWEAIGHSDAIVMNDAEWLKAERFEAGYSTLATNHPEKVLIETLGEKGSRFSIQNETFQLGIARPDRLIEVTGAGDAFCAGLIKGFLDGKNWKDAGKLGASLASFCVQDNGAQNFGKYSASAIYDRAKTVKTIQG